MTLYRCELVQGVHGLQGRADAARYRAVPRDVMTLYRCELVQGVRGLQGRANAV